MVARSRGYNVLIWKIVLLAMVGSTVLSLHRPELARSGDHGLQLLSGDFPYRGIAVSCSPPNRTEEPTSLRLTEESDGRDDLFGEIPPSPTYLLNGGPSDPAFNAASTVFRPSVSCLSTVLDRAPPVHI